MNVGFCGLGIMGSRMAANLAAAGHAMTVFNRTVETAEEWAARHGGTVAASPAEAASCSEVLITMLVDGAQVAVALDSIGGDDVLCIDMSTIGAEAARALGTGRRLLDAPVTGSSPKAQDGTLTIMCGGDPAEFAIAKPLFEVMGELVLHVGPLGSGQTIKVINNSVAAANASTVAQALIAGAATGVDLDALTQVMAAGSGGSAMLALKAAPMRAHDYATLFKLGHMLKDVRLCLSECDGAAVPFPAAAAAAEVLEAGVDRGDADKDFAALLDVLQERAGRTI